ncbi:hypothetical protein QBC41DRAFT_385189 [Cercophora samala]|uniref:Zn(2)-C6 fungal-type domain-containing protein n=1 Tax=Cercophora samala TaxID=330535 RepID=A0AA39ZN47_9PEZI|nr:hypothetical protein QBC41DRAFT_385189 [Cercophora samala]
MAEPSPSTNAGPNTVVIHGDSDSDDDEVLDVSKILRQKANIPKPSFTKAALVPPPPGSLAAEAQARPVPETPVKKRGLGWLDESPSTPAVGIDTITDTPITIPSTTHTAPQESIPPRAITTSSETRRENDRSKRSKEERERERLKTLEHIRNLQAKRKASKPRAFDDGTFQGSPPSSSRLPVVDLRTPSATSKAPSAAATISSRRSREKREDRKRRKELKKAARHAKQSRQESQPSRPPPPPPPLFQTAESRAVDREISKAIRHTPITAGQAAEQRLREIKARGAAAYQGGANRGPLTTDVGRENRGPLTTDFLEETATQDPGDAVLLLTKRLAEAEAGKRKTTVVRGMESGDIQRESRPYGAPRAQAAAAAAGPSRLQQVRDGAPEAITTPNRRQKAEACERCSRMKRMCNRGQPCSRCQTAEARCVYPSSVGQRDTQAAASQPERQQRESFVEQQYRLSLPQPGFREDEGIMPPPPPPPRPLRRPVNNQPRPPPPPPRSPSFSPSPEPESPSVDAVSAMDIFGSNQIIYQYVVYRTQKLPFVEGEEDPEEKRGDYAIRCSEHSKLGDANRQVMLRMNKAKKGVLGRGWKYRPGLDEGQRPGLADGRVDYGVEGGVEFYWVEVETRDLAGVVEVRGGRGNGELMVERVAGEVYQRRRWDVWGVVVVKREDHSARKAEKRLVFDCGGVEDRGVQTDAEDNGVRGEEMDIDVEGEVEVEENTTVQENVAMKENVVIEEDVQMANHEVAGTEDTQAEPAGESQLTGTTQAESQTTATFPPKNDLPPWHHDYYADSDVSSSGDDDDDAHTSPFNLIPPYNQPTPLPLPPSTNLLDLLTITPTLHGSFNSLHQANIAALRVLLSEARPRNNYMNDAIHYHSVFKPAQLCNFEEAGLDNEMTRALFNVTWRPPGDTPTEKYKWEFEEVRVWVAETELRGPIDLSDFVVRDGEGGGWVVSKGKKKAEEGMGKGKENG